MPLTKDIETANDHAVGIRGDRVLMLNPPPLVPMTAEHALRLAAWLVINAEVAQMKLPAGEEVTFERVLRACQKA